MLGSSVMVLGALLRNTCVLLFLLRAFNAICREKTFPLALSGIVLILFLEREENWQR